MNSTKNIDKELTVCAEDELESLHHRTRLIKRPHVQNTYIFTNRGKTIDGFPTGQLTFRKVIRITSSNKKGVSQVFLED